MDPSDLVYTNTAGKAVHLNEMTMRLPVIFASFGFPLFLNYRNIFEM